MSAVNRFREFIGLQPEANPEDVYEDAREGYDYPEERDRYAHDSYDREPRRGGRDYERSYGREDYPLERDSYGAPRGDYRDSHDGGLYSRRDPAPRREVYIIRPTSYDDAVTIGSQVREGNFVDMDLSQMGADAKRLVDFAAGLIFALDGAMSKVEARRFLISPTGVKLSPAQVQDIAASGVYLEP